MKTKLFYILLLLVGASCSSSKYASNFRDGGTQSGSKKMVQAEVWPADAVSSSDFTASASKTPSIMTSRTTSNETGIIDRSSLAGPEQKAFRKEVKKEIKKNIKSMMKEVKSLKVTSAMSAQKKGMDHDLKLAIIFGVIALILSALFGVSQVIGFLGFVVLVVAIVFLIKWLVRQ